MERHTCIPLFITWNIRLSLEVTSLLGMANYHSSSLLPISHVQHTQANSFSPLDLPFGPLTNLRGKRMIPTAGRFHGTQVKKPKDRAG